MKWAKQEFEDVAKTLRMDLLEFKANKQSTPKQMFKVCKENATNCSPQRNESH